LRETSWNETHQCSVTCKPVTNLVGVKLDFDVLQDFVSLDAWKMLGSLEYVSVELQYIG